MYNEAARLDRAVSASTTRDGMARQEEIAAFIRSSFRSIWALELLLYLKERPWASLSTVEIISSMRASSVIVSSSVDSLVAAGLIVQEDGVTFRYSPMSEEFAALVEETDKLYRAHPSTVRRIIVVGLGTLRGST